MIANDGKSELNFSEMCYFFFKFIVVQRKRRLLNSERGVGMPYFFFFHFRFRFVRPSAPKPLRETVIYQRDPCAPVSLGFRKRFHRRQDDNHTGRKRRARRDVSRVAPRRIGPDDHTARA